MMIWGYSQCKVPIINQIARHIGLPYDFDYVKDRTWRFLAQSQFNTDEICDDLVRFFLIPQLKRPETFQVSLLMDWTDLGQFVMLKVSIPLQGREIPIYFRVLDADDLVGRKTQTEVDVLTAILNQVGRNLAGKITVTADREFGKVQELSLIQDRGAGYAIRLKRSNYVKIGLWQGKLEDIPLYAGMELFFEGVEYTDEKKLLTNLWAKRLPPEGVHNHQDEDSYYVAYQGVPPEEVGPLYQRRPHIEQGFRDLKSGGVAFGGLNLDRMRVQTVESAAKLVAIVLLYYVVTVMTYLFEVTPEFVGKVSDSVRGKRGLSLFQIAQVYLARLTASLNPLLQLCIKEFWCQRHSKKSKNLLISQVTP
jgi:hypothetical protein